MITRIMAWWHAGQARRLEVAVRHYAIAYQAAKARYENALLDVRANNDEE
ncbi:hypothetical protein [Mesorhizobium retamae]|uniref:Uncharacterized protein n=1 Tax=Mesorhizobium retamae TaxID=2912854 RepID=A0ABS9QJN7_9HYPH|nr:hypothetical protein [Mesorhizobium sp. IRAMC:0171]MCG7507043.1 hypothetical protein [Mesorhizobium sp. IRAMC:0171]